MWWYDLSYIINQTRTKKIEGSQQLTKLKNISLKKWVDKISITEIPNIKNRLYNRPQKVLEYKTQIYLFFNNLLSSVEGAS